MMNDKNTFDFSTSPALPDAPDVSGLSFRNFQGEADFAAMARIFNDSREADGMDRVETVANLANQYAHLVNCNPYRDVIVTEMDGEMVGYGRCWHLQEIKGARLYLHYVRLLPKWRGLGIRQAMLRYNERRFRAIAAAHEHDGVRWLQSWAAETETHWQNALQAADYQIVRYNMNMARPNLNDIPNISLPPGIEVKRGALAAWRQIWEAAREAFRAHWGEVAWQEEDFLLQSNDPTFNPKLWQIAWDGDEIAGGILNFIDDEENTAHGRLRGYTEYVFVRRPWRKKGLARALLARSFQVLKEAGMTEAALGVDAENATGAVKLYTGMGFQIVKKTAVYRKPLEIRE
ncbi:MAG: GNAT family N-acetyltransferase [Chloroflexi bacterium]|nr:GNAT family N-acetyltransferase [Chloroflexota bacterium]